MIKYQTENIEIEFSNKEYNNIDRPSDISFDEGTIDSVLNSYKLTVKIKDKSYEVDVTIKALFDGDNSVCDSEIYSYEFNDNEKDNLLDTIEDDILTFTDSECDYYYDNKFIYEYENNNFN